MDVLDVLLHYVHGDPAQIDLREWSSIFLLRLTIRKMRSTTLPCADITAEQAL